MENRIIENPIGDERIEFIKTRADTGGEYLEFIQTLVGYRPGGSREHIHEDIDETYWILEGKAKYSLNGEWKTAGAGEMFFVPKGTKHINPFNLEPGVPLVMRRRETPEMGVEHFYRKLYQLSCEGEMNGTGRIGLLNLAVLAKNNPSVTYFTFSPRWIQRAWYMAAGSFAEMLGYSYDLK